MANGAPSEFLSVKVVGFRVVGRASFFLEFWTEAKWFR